MLAMRLLFFISIGALALALLPAHDFARAAPLVRDLMLGVLGDGRPITALRVGDGPRKFVLVGDTHGGPEANTYQLVAALAEYFRARPEEVPPPVSLYLIPTINPDGLAIGSRFNGRSVDLNRNMDT